MRYTRCEACGAKALLAASQCPKCGHLLGLRDTRGNPVPLSYCRGCDSYYLSSRGACRWCGATAPRASRIAPFIWGGVGLAAVAALGLGAWAIWQHRTAPNASTTSAVVAGRTSVPPATHSGDSLTGVSSAAADSVAAPAVVPSQDSLARVAAPAADTGIQAPAGDTSASEIRWITATAITWANVRSAPSRQAGIVAVISPDMRVRLGDARDGWHRVKAGGIDGWVDRRLFTVNDPGRDR